MSESKCNIPTKGIPQRVAHERFVAQLSPTKHTTLAKDLPNILRTLTNKSLWFCAVNPDSSSIG